MCVCGAAELLDSEQFGFDFSITHSHRVENVAHLVRRIGLSVGEVLDKWTTGHSHRVLLLTMKTKVMYSLDGRVAGENVPNAARVSHKPLGFHVQNLNMSKAHGLNMKPN